MKILYISFLLSLSIASIAQDLSISGTVLDELTNTTLIGVDIILQNGHEINTITSHHGKYKFKGLSPHTYTLTFYKHGYSSITKQIELTDQSIELNIQLKLLEANLEEVTVKSEKENEFGLEYLKPIEGTSIYAAKKNEVIRLDKINANLATNNSRQIYSKIAGLNVWESDGGGLQLGIGARGLSPNRTSNFNTRQNGYDISADALGYPESYYTPPSEALEKIEIIRGAASLQYGTQFGGLLNFVMKKGNEERGSEIISRQTVGSFGLFNTFNSIGGTAKRLNYYTFFQYKRGDGWRPNSSFDAYTGYISAIYTFNNKLSVKADLAYMKYNAQQPGGLTDVMFEQDPTQSIRERNWFNVSWNLASVSLDYKISEHTKINSRTFGLYAERNALGYLGSISRTDPLTERSLIKGIYNNIGNETRFIYQYNIDKQPENLLVGFRLYKGHTTNQQGNANDKNGSDYYFLNPDNLESDYVNPGYNTALFVENIFNLNNKVSITPGFRYENIITKSDGYYQEKSTDLAGNTIYEQKIFETKSRQRSFPLFGIGISYKPKEKCEIYGNFSQNYRSITFSDLRISNPNFKINPNIKDEKGYNADLGFRGRWKGIIQYDLSLFYLKYSDRIGIILQSNSQTFQIYNYRTNVADSRNIGFESLIEVSLSKLFKLSNKNDWSVFSNYAMTDAKYINSQDPSIQNKKVELVPTSTFKTGLQYKFKTFNVSYQFSYTGQQFTDATNAEYTANAVNGIIPSYRVMDISASYEYKRLRLETGINNFLNKYYFTRRATSYPGPGIIPADPRNLYLTLQVKI